MTKKVWTCICGHTKKESDGRKAMLEASRKAWEQSRKWKREQEDKRIARGVPIGDCSSCRQERTTCDYSCIGI